MPKRGNKLKRTKRRSSERSSFGLVLSEKRRSLLFRSMLKIMETMRSSSLKSLSRINWMPRTSKERLSSLLRKFSWPI